MRGDSVFSKLNRLVRLTWYDIGYGCVNAQGFADTRGEIWQGYSRELVDSWIKIVTQNVQNFRPRTLLYVRPPCEEIEQCRYCACGRILKKNVEVQHQYFVV